MKTGEQARAFAQIMRYHTVNGEWNPEHLTYSQMGRFLDKADPGNPKGTSDEAVALKDETGKPVANAFRNTWVTETALLHRAERQLHGREPGRLRARGRDRIAPQRYRLHHPRLGRAGPGIQGEGSPALSATPVTG